MITNKALRIQLADLRQERDALMRAWLSCTPRPRPAIERAMAQVRRRSRRIECQLRDRGLRP